MNTERSADLITYTPEKRTILERYQTSAVLHLCQSNHSWIVLVEDGWQAATIPVSVSVILPVCDVFMGRDVCRLAGRGARSAREGRQERSEMLLPKH